MPEYIEFILTEEKPKTNVYTVYNKKFGVDLGRIKWYGAWRQYCFFPNDDTLFNRECLQDIKDFIQKLMDERKQ